MARPEQTRDERGFLNAFLDLTSRSCSAIDHRDAPDFLLTLDGRRLAIEIVEVIDPDVRQGYMALRRLKDAVTQGLVRERLHASVIISVDEGRARAHHERPALVRENTGVILTLVRKLSLLGKGSIRLDGRALKDHGIQSIRQLSLCYSRRPLAAWALHGAGLLARDLQRAIARKDGKVASYRMSTPAEEHWLLVVGGHTTGASLDAHEAREPGFRSDFDRVFFLDCYESQVVELSLVRPS